MDKQTKNLAIVLKTILSLSNNTPCPEKKHPEHYRLSLKKMSIKFNNFWYKYFWHNSPSNDRPTYHLTQCLLLHYLGKNELTKYALK